MKKRILAFFLAVLMVVGLLPMTAFATETTYAITNGTPQGDAAKNNGYITVDETAAEGETVTITVKPNEGYQLKSLTCVPTSAVPADFVDLGITDADGAPLYWAEKNLGASEAEDYGDYFAWGETAPYYEGTGGWPDTPTWKEGKTSGYKWDSYCGQSTFVEWSTPPYDATSKILLPAYDAATKTNSSWRTPTSDEFKALAAGCVWISTTDYNSTGKAGYIVYKAKNNADKGKANMNGTWKNGMCPNPHT